MPTDDQEIEDRPPYLSLTTFTNFLDKLGAGPLPPRIDKSTLDTYSGGTQAIMLATLRSMRLINPDGTVTRALREAVASDASRKAHLREWARHQYARQIQLASDNATASMLHESFADMYQGSTLRKAVVFYLALTEYLDLPTSPHFKPPRQAKGNGTRRRIPRSKAPSAAPLAEEPPPRESPAKVPAGEVTTIKIGDTATLTIIVNAQWMKLPLETITKMRKAIASLEALGEKADIPPRSDDGEDES